MVYSWVTSTVDQIAVAYSGVWKLFFRLEWIELHLICTQLFTSILVLERCRWISTYLWGICVCVAQARATSCKPLWKPQLLIQEVFMLVLAYKHVGISTDVDWLTCLPMSFHLNIFIFKTSVGESSCFQLCLFSKIF